VNQQAQNTTIVPAWISLPHALLSHRLVSKTELGKFSSKLVAAFLMFLAVFIGIVLPISLVSLIVGEAVYVVFCKVAVIVMLGFVLWKFSRS
jgi:hypothetical protein